MGPMVAVGAPRRRLIPVRAASSAFEEDAP
jgi:hypothetical protein